jgi:NAD(P)-dependent dehydrogenase (short-subunit alcohol dehydrogenase family)
MKIAVITGVSRGLGRALAMGFARHGFVIVGCARSGNALGELERELPAPHRFDAVDVTDAEAVSAWAQEVLASHGPPDWLINNAGAIHDNVPFTEIPPETFDTVVRVAVSGTANVIRAFLPAMAERNRGIILNFSSGAGHQGYTGLAGYCAAKHGVEGLSRALATEVPDGMAVIPFQPGVIHTDMLEQRYGDKAAEHEPPDQWIERAMPFLLGLGPDQNGESLRLPDP